MSKEEDIVTIDIGKMTQEQINNTVKKYTQRGYKQVDTNNDYWDTEVLYGIIQFTKGG